MGTDGRVDAASCRVKLRDGTSRLRRRDVLVASISAFLCISLFAAPTNLSPATAEANPVRLLSDLQYGYFWKLSKSDRKKVMKSPSSVSGYSGVTTETFCNGTPLTLSWTGTSGTCTVSVKRLSDGTVIWTGTTSKTSIDVVNLELGAGYTWTVTDSSKNSASATFYTLLEPPRLIKSGTMRMMRDLGGWKGLDGCRIRQNQIFRGGPANSKGAPDDAARTFFYDIVGLKTEIDFRGKSEAGTNPAFDNEGKHVKYYLLPTDVYKFYKPKEVGSGNGKNYADTIKMLMNVGGTYRPAYFHCAVGRDRTGSMAGFILALLGVSEEDIWRDYAGSCYVGETTFYDTFGTYLDSIRNYKSTSSSLAESAKQYCLDIGITEEQIETFRKEMLIGYGEPPKPTYHVEEPVYVTATRVTFASGEATGTQYTGFETKTGLEYAWGKDGKAETEWKKSDGTPLELKKPEGDGWELMVRSGAGR